MPNSFFGTNIVGRTKQQVAEGMIRDEYVGENRGEKYVAIRRPATYNTSKRVIMYGPKGEIGEIYSNGKMYIILADGRYKTRTFPSRPTGIKAMIARGWVKK
jgi:hypothetical protein